MRNTLYYRPLQRLDSPTDRKNPLVQSLLSGQILPVTGTFFPQTCLQKSRFFQPLEESSRSKPAQRPKTSSQWRNHPAYRPLCVLILPATGGIRTQKAIDLTVRMGCYGTRMRSCGVHRRGSGGNLRAGPDRMGRIALRGGRPGLLRTKTKKLRGEHEGTRIGPLTGHMGRGRTSMTNTRRAKARRRFRNRRFRYVTRAAGRGQRCRNGGNLEGTDNRKEPKQNPGNRMISTVSGVQIRAEDTRFCAECEKSLIFRQFSRLQGDDATVIPTVYTGQHVPSSSATVNSTIIPIVVCMTLKQLPMARSALQEGRLSCQQRSLLGIWNLSP